MTWKKFAQRLLAMAVVTVCVIAVLLITANSPSKDEVTRGGAAGIIAYIATKLFCRVDVSPIE